MVVVRGQQRAAPRAAAAVVCHVGGRVGDDDVRLPATRGPWGHRGRQSAGSCTGRYPPHTQGLGHPGLPKVSTSHREHLAGARATTATSGGGESSGNATGTPGRHKDWGPACSTTPLPNARAHLPAPHPTGGPRDQGSPQPLLPPSPKACPPASSVPHPRPLAPHPAGAAATGCPARLWQHGALGGTAAAQAHVHCQRALTPPHRASKQGRAPGASHVASQRVRHFGSWGGRAPPSPLVRPHAHTREGVARHSTAPGYWLAAWHGVDASERRRFTT